LILLLGVAAVLLLADAAWAGTGLVGSLRVARAQLQAGASSLLDGNLAEARQAFEVAAREAQGAVGSLRHPSVWVADVLPGTGDDVDAVQALARSAADVATAGQRLVDAAEASGWDGSSIPGIKGTSIEQAPEEEPSDEDEDSPAEGDQPEGGRQGQSPQGGRGPGDRGEGRGGAPSGDAGAAGPRPGKPRGESSSDLQVALDIDLKILRLAAPQLQAAAGAITRAEQALASIEGDLWFPVRDAVAEARGQVVSRAGLIRRVSQLAQLLPGFLGGEEPRRYFLAFQNLSAPRGSGGFMGVYGILEAEGGRISLQRMASVRELEAARNGVDAPPDYLARYRRFGGTTEFIAANYSPHFPTTGKVLLNLYEATEGERLDGVVAVDPLWLAYTMKASGTVKAAAWPEPLSPQTVSDVLHHDVFLLDKQESDAAQIALGEALITGLLEDPLNPRALVEGISRSAGERHLQVFAARPEEQALIERLGADGSVRLGSNPLFVVWQDATNNKAGYFARKEVEHRIALQPDGSAVVTSTIRLRNEAPDGPPSVLLGSGQSGDEPGHFAAYVNVYLPAGSTEITSEIGDSPGLGLVESEFGRPVVLELLSVPPGESATLTVRYRVPGAAAEGGDAWAYRAGFVPQPALRPDALTVEISVPPGSAIAAAAPVLDRGGGTVRYEGRPSRPVGFWVQYVAG
jgi:Protein of unknown function (DUF4012)